MDLDLVRVEDDLFHTNGVLPKRIDVRDYKLARPCTASPFPETFKLQMQGIKNQGSVGSCVAHALSEVVEYFNRNQQGTAITMSTGFIYGDRRNSSYKGSGMHVRDALSNLRNYGDVPNSAFRYNVEVPKAIELFESAVEDLSEEAFPNRISTYFNVSSDEDIKYALMNHGPVVFAIDGYRDIKVNKQGIMESTRESKNKTGRHCMVIYGGNESGGEIMNSGGRSGGVHGCAVLPYDYPRTETGGVTDTIIEDSRDIVKPIWSGRFAKLFTKIVNWFLNLFRK